MLRNRSGSMEKGEVSADVVEEARAMKARAIKEAMDAEAEPGRTNPFAEAQAPGCRRGSVFRRRPLRGLRQRGHAGRTESGRGASP